MNELKLQCLFLCACLLGHSAARQTELRLAIRLCHPAFLHYNKRANIIDDL